MGALYTIFNAPMQTTAAMVKVTTGTAIKTMSQIATPSTSRALLHSWGFTLDDPPGADAIFELLETDVAATVTAHVASGVQPTDAGAPVSPFTLGVAATGYTATAEGSITATRTFDVKLMDLTSGATDQSYSYQFMPRERPLVSVSKFLRVRATTPSTAVDMLCWVKLEPC